MADFNFYINRQGIQGRKGDKGDTGFSPAISVGTDTPNEYKLIIANESNSFETPNLRGNINVINNGGTYLRYDAETQQISAQGLDAATSTNVGGVLMSTNADIEGMGDSSVITPADLADALPKYLQGEGAVTITQDVETSKTKINVDLSSVDSLTSRVSAAEAEIVGIQADVANLNSDISTLNSVTANHTTSISAINNNIADLNNNKVAKTDFATTETAGIVKVDGTTITVDGNGVITSVGGGGAGDVTAAGDNTFTGSNNFTKQVSLSNGAILGDYIPIEFGTSTSTGSQVMNRGTIQNEHTEFTKTYPSGSESYLLANTLKINGGYNLILDAGSIKDQDLSTLQDYTYKGKILDGDGNIILSQGNVTAGEGVTINKTENGIEITVNNSGGGSTPSNMVTTDTEQTITANKTISNGSQLKFYKETGASNNGAIYNHTSGNFILECQNNTGATPESIILGEQGLGSNYSRRGIFLSVPSDEAIYLGYPNYACKVEAANDLKLYGGHKQNSYLHLSNDELKYTKSDGTSIDLLAGGGGGSGTPENMVTTNTDQYINSIKVFNYDKSVTNAASNAVELGNQGIRFRTFTSGYEHRIEGYDYSNGSLTFGGFGNGIKFGNSVYDKNGNEIVGGGLTAEQAANASMGSNNTLELALPVQGTVLDATAAGIVTIRINAVKFKLKNNTTQEEFWISAGGDTPVLLAASIRVNKGDKFVYTSTKQTSAPKEFYKFTYLNCTNPNA